MTKWMLVLALALAFVTTARADPVLAPSPATDGYAVVVSKATDADPAWQKVVAALLAKYLPDGPLREVFATCAAVLDEDRTDRSLDGDLAAAVRLVEQGL